MNVPNSARSANPDTACSVHAVHARADLRRLHVVNLRRFCGSELVVSATAVTLLWRLDLEAEHATGNLGGLVSLAGIYLLTASYPVVIIAFRNRPRRGSGAVSVRQGDPINIRQAVLRDPVAHDGSFVEKAEGMAASIELFALGVARRLNRQSQNASRSLLRRDFRHLHLAYRCVWIPLSRNRS